jgi:hypothetical protein
MCKVFLGRDIDHTRPLQSDHLGRFKLTTPGRLKLTT